MITRYKLQDDWGGIFSQRVMGSHIEGDFVKYEDYKSEMWKVENLLARFIIQCDCPSLASLSEEAEKFIRNDTVR